MRLLGNLVIFGSRHQTANTVRTITGVDLEETQVALMFNGCTTTLIFCRPGCPPGRRMKPEHRVDFATGDQAFNAGYRPCLVCKPLDGPPGPWKPKSDRRL